MDALTTTGRGSPGTHPAAAAVRRVRSLALLLGGVLVLAASCDHSTPTEPLRPTPTPVGPTPAPTATPTPIPYPAGVANATAFENLAHVTQLERSLRTSSILGTVRGDAELDGRVAPGSTWTYYFVDGAAGLEDVWNVWNDGHVTYYQYVPPVYNTTIPGPLRIDSPEAIRRALAAGIDAFTAIHPDALVNVWYWGSTCQMQFFDRTHVDRCEPMVYLDSTTGEVLTTYLSCIGGG